VTVNAWRVIGYKGGVWVIKNTHERVNRGKGGWRNRCRGEEGEEGGAAGGLLYRRVVRQHCQKGTEGEGGGVREDSSIVGGMCSE